MGFVPFAVVLRQTLWITDDVVSLHLKVANLYRCLVFTKVWTSPSELYCVYARECARASLRARFDTWLRAGILRDCSFEPRPHMSADIRECIRLSVTMICSDKLSQTKMVATSLRGIHEGKPLDAATTWWVYPWNYQGCIANGCAHERWQRLTNVATLQPKCLGTKIPFFPHRSSLIKLVRYVCWWSLTSWIIDRSVIHSICWTVGRLALQVADMIIRWADWLIVAHSIG